MNDESFFKMYSDYVKEREGLEIFATLQGFATYKICQLECYIKDIYVIPLYRDQKVAAHMADEITKIAKEKGCTYLMGSVCPKGEGSTDSLKVLLAYGFKLLRSHENIVYFYKEI